MKQNDNGNEGEVKKKNKPSETTKNTFLTKQKSS